MRCGRHAARSGTRLRGGRSGRGPRPLAQEVLVQEVLVQEAERLGYGSVWTAEFPGWDAFTPFPRTAARTSTIRLGTAVAQNGGPHPGRTAMHALTLEHLSGGRMPLGLGLSGPQVVEGRYGRPFPQWPLTGPWILMYPLDADRGNSLVRSVHDVAVWPASWSHDLFTFDAAWARVVTGYGLAAAVYLFAGHAIANRMHRH